MAQSTLEDDELFDEASDELREDVEDALEDAHDALPDADGIFEVEGDNIVGVLNSLKTELDAGEAEESLREAKKWFGVGRKADVFDDEFVDETEEELEELEDALGSLADAEENATELTDTLAGLKSVL